MKADFLQTEVVEKQVYRYFDAVYRADIDTLRTIFHKKASLYGEQNGEFVVGTPDIFFEDLQSKPSMQLQNTDCRCVITHMDVSGNVASVTLLVDGFYGAACVKDHFHLLHDGPDWKIVCKSFTVVD